MSQLYQESWMHRMPVPEQFTKYRLTRQHFVATYGSIDEYNRRHTQVTTAPQVDSITSVQSWDPQLIKDQINRDWLKRVAEIIETLSPRSRCLHLLTEISGIRLLVNVDEYQSFLGWIGSSYQPFWSPKSGKQALKELVDADQLRFI